MSSEPSDGSSALNSSASDTTTTTATTDGTSPPPYSPTLSAMATEFVPPDIDEMLRAIGMRDALNSMRDRKHTLAPFEMRQVLDPARAGRAIEVQTTIHVPFMEGVRNTLVVVPLMLTWLAFGLAASAYQQSLPFYKSGAIPPMFQLWQEGFPDLKALSLGPLHVPLVVSHLHILAFAGVAFVDVAILLTIFLLTWRTQMTEARGIRYQRKLSRWLELQLLALSEQSFAWTRNPADPNKPAWVNEIEGAVTKLMDGVQSVYVVNETVAGLTKQYQLIKESLELLDKTVPEMKRQVELVGDQQADTREMWAALTRQFQATVRNLAQVTGTLSGNPNHLRELERLRYTPRSRQSSQAGRSQRGPFAWLRRVVRRVWPGTGDDASHE